MIVGLCGYEGSGKDTVARLLGDNGFEQVSYADPIRDLILQLDPWWVDADLGAVRVSHLVERLGWELLKRHHTWGPHYRRWAQSLGDGVRAMHDQAFVNGLLQRLEDQDIGPWWNRPLVISDVRYPNENIGDELWLVSRPGTEPINDHSSAQLLVAKDATRTIENVGDLADLRKAVDDALVKALTRYNR